MLRELKRRHPDAEIRFWCDYKFTPQARGTVHALDDSIPVQSILSGKLRRYHHLKWWQHFTIPSVLFPNIRDIFLVGAGVIQSFIMLLFWRPDVMFAKGGFVCLPAGIAARLLKIPLVIHDSDSHPGLTNRILAKWATFIATGAPLHNYPYNKKITHYTGIPIREEFRPYNETERKAVKKVLGFDENRPLVVVTGGGTGAGVLNDAVVKRFEALTDLASVILLCGVEKYDEVKALVPQDDSRFRLFPFITGEGMAETLGSAEVAVSRAGATTILELSALARPTILVPAAHLTAGHQLKNAAEYADKGAVEVIGDEEIAANPQLLVDMIGSLLVNPEKRLKMAKTFYAMSKPDAAVEVVDLIERAVEKR